MRIDFKNDDLNFVLKASDMDRRAEGIGLSLSEDKGLILISMLSESSGQTFILLRKDELSALIKDLNMISYEMVE